MNNFLFLKKLKNFDNTIFRSVLENLRKTFKLNIKQFSN